MNDEVHDLLRTKELRLVDKDGRDCATLHTGDDGLVSLTFLDSQNKVRTRIGVNEHGQAVVALGRGDGGPSILLSVDPDGHMVIEGVDTEAVVRVKLELKGNGSHTELSFNEKHRHPRMVLMAEDKGPAGLFIMDQHGRALFTTTP